MPDGRNVNVSRYIRFTCPEMLFNAGLEGKKTRGIHQIAWDAVQECDLDIRKEVFRNLVLAGGNSMYTGLADRMQTELTGLLPANV